MRKAADVLEGGPDLPEGFLYSVKRRLLGPPLVNEQLGEQRLSRPLALGVLSPDGISSSAYGTEEILIELLPYFGLVAFTLILPFTLVILLVMLLVILSYREVVMVYIRPGGSYVVARQNFGPKTAQVCAVALLIDYIVTVAVQTAAGTAAIASTFPAIGPYDRWITIGVVLLMCFGNLRGIKEAGRFFAIPTYLFSGAVILMIVVGLIREIFFHLPVLDLATVHDTIKVHHVSTLVLGVTVFTLLKAFANGGASLTGIEAVSDAVGGFRPPEGRNARQVLVAEGIILGVLVAGISWLAHASHATPRSTGYPTVLAQEADLVFGHTFVGQILFYVVQAATALILYTGANTSFNGFPFLASYVAGDAFLPRWLLKRGHRLVFSNAIILLTIASVALIIIRGSNVNNLVPLYAIGVFTAFSMAGFGMARYHSRRRERGWRRKLVINFSAGVLTAIVVAIFAVVKFTEGAWIVVVLFAILVPALIRLNREYTMESEVLAAISGRQPPPPPHYSRRTVFLFVDSFDLATIAALRYARSLRPTSLRAVHFVIDSARAEKLREEWTAANRGVVLDFIDVPDRRLTKAAAELVGHEVEDPGTHVTVILPRRSYSAWFGRVLHDRTADKIAAVVSRIPRSAATIVPYDVQSRVRVLQERVHNGLPPIPPGGTAPDGAKPNGAKPNGAKRPAESPAGPRQPAGDGQLEPTGATAASAGQESPSEEEMKSVRKLRDMIKGRDERDAATGDRKAAAYDRPKPPSGVKPIGTLSEPGKASIEGRVRALEIRPVEQNSVLAIELADSTGDLTALFYGRSHIAGVICGSKLRLRGPVGFKDGHPVMINPAYELVGSDPDADS
ncbi:MAG: amino acid permease [Actinobacteria bacterium]|nr:amino acid permease [Actinomycetota bacterium]